MEITTEKAIQFSKELAQNIRKEFDPDLIIGIREGGVLPAVEVSRAFAKPVSWIQVSRIEKELEAKFDEEYMNSDYEKRKEVSKTFDEIWFKSNPRVIYSDTLDIKGRKVLVIDDAVHSGKTLDVVLEFLSEFEPAVIKTAALFHVEEYMPDFSIGKGEHKYPWSTWAKFEEDYAPYQEYLNNL